MTIDKKDNQAIASNENSNQPEPKPAIQLEHAMLENSRADTQESRNHVYQELLFSDLLLALVDGPVPTAPADPNTPQNLNVAIMTNPQNVQFAAAFTSADAAKKWRPDNGQYVGIRGQEIFKLLEPSPAEVIVINPGSVPFAILSKAEYKSLAQGVMPQAAESPVKAQAEQPQNQGEMQISFPPDAFSEPQKQTIELVLQRQKNIEAAALGALLPPNAPNQSSWLRTIFLRLEKPETNQEVMQKFCVEIRDSIISNSAHFENVQIEVGVMPDANFWVAVNENKFVLFDKNPPKASSTPPPEKPSGTKSQPTTKIPNFPVRRA